jgi:hypothetical protein
VSKPYELENHNIALGDEPRAGLVGTQIELRRAGHEPVLITVTEKHVWKAKVWQWPTAMLLADAIWEQLPDDLL